MMVMSQLNIRDAQIGWGHNVALPKNISLPVFEMNNPHHQLLDLAHQLKLPVHFSNDIYLGMGNYNPRDDYIRIYTAMIQNNNLNLVLAHELVHATGHPKRLNRSIIARYLHNKYALMEPGMYKQLNEEEIIAQWGAYNLLKSLGIDTFKDKNWTYDYILRYKDGKSGFPNELQEKKALEAVNYLMDHCYARDLVSEEVFD